MLTQSEMNWFCVAKIPKPYALSELESFLISKKVEFKITDDDNEYSLWVCNREEWEEIKSELEPAGPQSVWQGLGGNSLADWRVVLAKIPVTTSAIVICCCLYFIESIGVYPLINMLTFRPFDYLYETNEWWRLFTPAILHVGGLHLLFNMLWAWQLGARIESHIGKLPYLLILFIGAIFSNVVQYMSLDNIYFRGFSGVVYVYVGFLWIHAKSNPAPILYLPNAVYYFMFFWLGLGVIGLIDWILPIKIANGAHVGGLVIGLALAKILALYQQRGHHQT